MQFCRMLFGFKRPNMRQSQFCTQRQRNRLENDCNYYKDAIRIVTFYETYPYIHKAYPLIYNYSLHAFCAQIPVQCINWQSLCM